MDHAEHNANDGSPQGGAGTPNVANRRLSRAVIFASCAAALLAIVGVAGPRAMPSVLLLFIVSLLFIPARPSNPSSDGDEAPLQPRRGRGGSGLSATIVQVLLPDLGSPLRHWCRVQWLLLALVCFGAWAAVTLAWTPAPIQGLIKVATYAAIVLLTARAVLHFAALAPCVQRRIVDAFAIGLAAVAAFIVIEVLSDQAIKIWFMNAFPELRGSTKNMSIADNTVLSVHMLERNRSIAVLNMLFWPVALWAWVRSGAWMGATSSGGTGRGVATSSRVFWLAASVCWLTLLAITMLGEHETSKVAVLAGAIAAGAAWASTVWARRLLSAAFILTVVGVIPLANGLYSAGLHLSDTLPMSAKARVILWNVTADQWRERPITGVGVAGTRAIDDAEADEARRPDGYVYSLRTGRHAHNVYLQTFFELGLIGAALLLACGVMMVMASRRLVTHAQPAALATFAVSAAMIGISWGMWQAWFQSALAAAMLTTILVAMASAHHVAVAGRREAKVAPAVPAQSDDALAHARPGQDAGA